MIPQMHCHSANIHLIYSNLILLVEYVMKRKYLALAFVCLSTSVFAKAIPPTNEALDLSDKDGESFFYSDARTGDCYRGVEEYKELDINGCSIFVVYQWRDALSSKNYSLRDTMLAEARTGQYSKTGIMGFRQMLNSFAVTLKSDSGAKWLVKDKIIKNSDIPELRAGLKDIGYCYVGQERVFGLEKCSQ